MTTISNDLEVDGTISASQATQAGEAVVLGEDGLVPASLIASSGAATPYFLVKDGPIHVTGLVKGSKRTGRMRSETKRIVMHGCPQIMWGAGSTIYYVECRPSLLPGIGLITAVQVIYSRPTGAYSNASYNKYSIDKDSLQAILNDNVRTNLRGQFTLKFCESEFNTGNVVENTSNTIVTSDVDVNITDEGIEVLAGSLNVLYKDTSDITEGNLYLNLWTITADDPGWC